MGKERDLEGEERMGRDWRNRWESGKEKREGEKGGEGGEKEEWEGKERVEKG